MIVSFKDEGTRDIWESNHTRRAGKTCPPHLWSAAHRRLVALDEAARLDDLREPPGNRLEWLTGDRLGTCSIRINNQYRVCFRWTDAGPEDVEIVDYH